MSTPFRAWSDGENNKEEQMTDTKAAATATSRISGKTVTLVATPGAKITPEVVHGALEQIFRLNGCLACGLLGIDLHVHGGDPDPLLGGLQGFNGVVR
jgi:hypothetical protein